MRSAKPTKRALLMALLMSPFSALACSEMMFNSGGGLPFQSYLAPRSANVLVLWTNASHDTYYAELERAGHRITLVADRDDMAMELAQADYDIVIADYDELDLVPPEVANNTGSGPRLVPIVARSLRKSPQVRDRFEQILLDGASVAQYLTVINRVLDSVI